MRWLIRVPGTSANLGTGFDTLGLAVDLWNESMVEVVSGQRDHQVQIDGEGASSLPADADHLILKVASDVCRSHGGQMPTLRCRFSNRLPLARGLGSSAAARVTGAALGLLLAKGVADQAQVAAEATKLEGHPDNVVPAVYGGLTASLWAPPDQPLHHRYAIDGRWRLVVVIPEFHLETERSRQALPSMVTFSDACHNLARLPLLLAALEDGRPELLPAAIVDVLHQPYRVPLVPGIREVFRAAVTAGARGAYLSGAGPSVAAWVWQDEAVAQQVGQAMVAAFGNSQVQSRFVLPQLTTQGLSVSSI